MQVTHPRSLTGGLSRTVLVACPTGDFVSALTLFHTVVNLDDPNAFGEERHMLTRSVIRLGALCGILAGAAFLASPASAAYLINPGFDTVGPDGSPVTTMAPPVEPPYTGGGPSAALGWSQFVVWPSGSLTSELLPTTDPFGSGQMMHIATDSGDYPPAEQGNGFAQAFLGDALLPQATVTYDLYVASGEVWGGLVAADGAFQSNTPHFGPTGVWIQVTDHMLPGLLSGEVAFETLTLGTSTGADYYVDNLNVTAVPEPATMTLLAGGLGGLVMRRRRASKAHTRSSR
jgi:hypothetical protein